jgi:bifunctional ADP-heptose synthase (sugar kinase/adenylyltransferase)
LPHVLVKGGDYVDKVVAGADAVVANGGKVEFIPLLEGFSSTGLIGKILNGAK